MPRKCYYRLRQRTENRVCVRCLPFCQNADELCNIHTGNWHVRWAARVLHRFWHRRPEHNILPVRYFLLNCFRYFIFASQNRLQLASLWRHCAHFRIKWLVVCDVIENGASKAILSCGKQSFVQRPHPTLYTIARFRWFSSISKMARRSMVATPQTFICT